MIFLQLLASVVTVVSIVTLMKIRNLPEVPAEILNSEVWKLQTFFMWAIFAVFGVVILALVWSLPGGFTQICIIAMWCVLVALFYYVSHSPPTEKIEI